LQLRFLLVIPEGDLQLQLQLKLRLPLPSPLFVFVILSEAKNPCIPQGERSDPECLYQTKK
jgi:hypothetical protein